MTLNQGLILLRAPLGLAMILLVACADPSLSPLRPDATILAFGDSLTFGTGAGVDHSYPTVLAEQTGLRVVNAGVPGEISEAGKDRLPRVLEEHRPALVILIHGGNDTLRNLAPANTKANLAAMVEASRAASAQLVMLGVPGRNITLSVPSYYKEVAESLGVPIDTSTLPRLMRDRAMKSDAVHFNGAGYRRMATAVSELLRDEGALAQLESAR